MTLASGSEYTSAVGAKFMLMPSAASSRPEVPAREVRVARQAGRAEGEVARA